MMRHLIVFLLFIVACGAAASAQSYRGTVNDGNDLYHEKKYDRAREKYEQAAIAEPERPESFFNAGNAAYRSDDVITSYSIHYTKLYEELAGKVDLLHFSLDSADAEQHNAMRGVDCFGHVLESIEIAKQLGEKPDLLFTVTNENTDQLSAVYDLAREHGLMLLVITSYSIHYTKLYEFLRSKRWSRSECLTAGGGCYD